MDSNRRPLVQKAAPLHLTTKLSGTWVKGKGWTSARYPFPEAILVQATTSTTTQYTHGRKDHAGWPRCLKVIGL